jgi:hypothetical protein
VQTKVYPVALRSNLPLAVSLRQTGSAEPRGFFMQVFFYYGNKNKRYVNFRTKTLISPSEKAGIVLIDNVVLL